MLVLVSFLQYVTVKKDFKSINNSRVWCITNSDLVSFPVVCAKLQIPQTTRGEKEVQRLRIRVGGSVFWSCILAESVAPKFPIPPPSPPPHKKGYALNNQGACRGFGKVVKLLPIAFGWDCKELDGKIVKWQTTPLTPLRVGWLGYGWVVGCLDCRLVGWLLSTLVSCRTTGGWMYGSLFVRE